MEIGQKGLELIKSFEGLKLTSYVCPAGIQTIGYGTTRIDGKSITKELAITKEQAEEYLKKDLASFEKGVTKLVLVPINQEMFDALVCFVYNVGIGSLEKSTLLKLLNSKQYKATSEQFSRWNKANGKVLSGLTKRRAAEAALFTEGYLKI